MCSECAESLNKRKDGGKVEDSWPEGRNKGINLNETDKYASSGAMNLKK